MPEMAQAIESMAMRSIKNAQTAELAMLVRLSRRFQYSLKHICECFKKLDQSYTNQSLQQVNHVRRTTTRIRIAYIASEFGDHPISHVMWDVFKHHDRDSFEVIVYSLANRQGDIDQVYINHIKTYTDQYIDISNLTQKQSAERIAQDEIDILINLSGYMTLNCVQICSFRPAPINVYWLGQGGRWDYQPSTM